MPEGIFPGLIKPVAATPAPRVDIAPLYQEFHRLVNLLAGAADGPSFEHALEATASALTPLTSNVALAVTERLAVLQQTMPAVADTLSAMMTHFEIARWATVFMLDPVSLCPAAAAARENEEEDEDES